MKVTTHANIALHEISIESVATEDLCELFKFTGDYVEHEVRGELIAVRVENDHDTGVPMIQVFERVDKD